MTKPTTLTATAALAMALGFAATAPLHAAGDTMSNRAASVTPEVCNTAFAKFSTMGGHIDEDHDTISMAEASASDFPPKAFEKLDRNGNGKVSREEFSRCGTAQAEMAEGGWDIIAFTTLDASGDGTTGAAEAAAEAKAAAARAARAAEEAEAAAERVERMAETAERR